MKPTEMDLVSYSELRQHLAEHLAQCNKRGKRFKIIRNGKPEGILLSSQEWDQICETLAIVTSPALMKQIIRSESDIKRGRVHDLDSVFHKLLGDS